jgi:hypothetical protein
LSFYIPAFVYTLSRSFESNTNPSTNHSGTD